MRNGSGIALVAAAGALAASASFGQHGAEATVSVNPAGEPVFAQNCAMCHVKEGAEGGDPRAPKLETLNDYPPERIVDALTTGKMQPQGSMLTVQQRNDVSEWLAKRKIGAGDAVAGIANPCRTAGAMTGRSGWNGWGGDDRNARFQTAAAGGLTAADLPALKVKWAFGFPGGAQVASQPSVVGGWLFVGSDAGQVYALDAASGCVHWAFKAKAAVRTAPVVASLGDGGRPAVFVGDLQGRVYAVDAATGEQIWVQQIDERPQIRVLGSPVVSGGRVFVGVSSGEEGSLRRKDYECCRFRGSVSALDTSTGKRLWQSFIVDEPRKLPVGGDGRQRWGPSGGGVWTTPTVDPKRGRIYIGTGNAYTGPANRLNDSVVAFDMRTGAVAWSYQDTPEDVWMFGCKPEIPGCAAKVGPDADYAASMILQTLPDGRDVLIAAHKGGVAMALDPDRSGARLWRRPLANGTPTEYGDILFGGAADGAKVYYALQETAAVAALDIGTGVVRWKEALVPIAGRAKRVGAGAAVTGMSGAVLSGGWDGVLRAYATDTGKVLWSFDTVRPFQTVNGVTAKGGSMGGPGPTVAGGMLYVGSGYVGVSNGMPGNVLLAFGR